MVLKKTYKLSTVFVWSSVSLQILTIFFRLSYAWRILIFFSFNALFIVFKNKQNKLQTIFFKLSLYFYQSCIYTSHRVIVLPGFCRQRVFHCSHCDFLLPRENYFHFFPTDLFGVYLDISK